MDNKKVENKKHMSNKKKFWVGMSALAAVGAITATVAYFSSVHEFNKDTFSTHEYSISTQKVLDEDAISKMVPNKSTAVQVSATNEGSVPALARVTYQTRPLTNKGTPWGNDTTTGFTDVKLEEIENWKFTLNAGTKFEQSGDSNDKAYYLTKVLTAKDTPDAMAIHLTNVTYTGNGTKGTTTTDTKSSENTPTLKTYINKYTVGQDGIELKVKIETIQATNEHGATLTNDDLGTGAKVRTAWEAIRTAQI